MAGHASVIQGSFPHGLPRLSIAAPAAQPFAAHATPAWVQARVGSHGAPQPHTVQRHATPAHPNALPLPPHMAPLPTHGGQPLPPQVRQRMEAAFGARFDDVRIHITPQAQVLGASAFTHGSHIHFAPGQYDPHTHQGQQLLGRELAHVVQQRAGRVHNPFGSGLAIVHDRMLEAEAERLAMRAVTVQRAVRPVIQRLKRITDLLKRHNEIVSPQDMLVRYTKYLMSVAEDYDEKLIYYTLQGVLNGLLNNPPLTSIAISAVREKLDEAAGILRKREKGNNNNEVSIDDYTLTTIDFSSFKKEKIVEYKHKNKNKNKNNNNNDDFVSLEQDVKNELYTMTTTKSTKIQMQSGEKDFPDQSGITVSQAVQEAIDVIDLSGSSTAAYSRHDYQDSRKEVVNLQIQLGGSKLNYRQKKGDTSSTLVIIDAELFKKLKKEDPKRLLLILKAAHKLSYNTRSRVEINPP